jgi:hypothetical protein
LLQPYILIIENDCKRRELKMLSRSIFLSTIFFYIQLLPAQAPDTLWTNTFGGDYRDEGIGVLQTSDGGYIVAGNTQPSFGYGNGDIWMIRTDQYGDTLWTKTLGGSGDDVCSGICLTTGGGFIIVGTTSSFGAGNTDVWLIKTDSSGDTLWTKTFGTTKYEAGRCIQRTSDGGFIFLGDFSWSWPNGTSQQGIWLLKTDSNGDTLWTSIIYRDFHTESSSIQETSDGGYIVVGYSLAISEFDLWVIKTDSNGDTLWTKTYDKGKAYSVLQTADDGYVIVGAKIPYSYVGYIWLLKTDCNGDTLWTKTYGDPFINIGYSVKKTTDGGYVIAGGTSDSYMPFSYFKIIRTDSIGSALWTKTYSNGTYGYDIQLTTDGGYIAVGYVYIDLWATNSDILLIKTEPDPVLFIDQKPVFISGYKLHQNYPNPFNPTTTIEFDLPKTSQVSLKIFNILGEEVATLVSDKLSSGSYAYEWDASNIASGVYLYRLQADDYVETRRMVLMR